MQDVHNDPLWRIARKRAVFKKSVFTYIIFITFFWAMWWFSKGRYIGFTGFPWPAWVMLGWGIALAFQYFDAYKGTYSLTEEEYKRLKHERGNQ